MLPQGSQETMIPGTSDDLVTITEELILSGRSSRGGWTREQLALRGVAWPPQSGWKAALVGRQIPRAVAGRFVALKR